MSRAAAAKLLAFAVALAAVFALATAAGGLIEPDRDGTPEHEQKIPAENHGHRRG
jgi:hypothetical protein